MTDECACRVVLIGMMGSDKTTIGRLLARRTLAEREQLFESVANMKVVTERRRPAAVVAEIADRLPAGCRPASLTRG